MRILLLIMICFTTLISKATTPPNDTTCKNNIHVNFPVVNLIDPDDSVFVRIYSHNMR
jgi:hypothetical protein